MSIRSTLRAASALDVLIALTALSVLAALAYPSWRARELRKRVDRAVVDVDAVTAGARNTLARLERWPTVTPAGQVPPELSALGLTQEGYALAWTTWDVVDSITARTDDVGPAAPGDAPDLSAEPSFDPITRVVGSVAVHSSDDVLLGALMDHYGPGESFVIDTTWFRVLPERAVPATTAR